MPESSDIDLGATQINVIIITIILSKWIKRIYLFTVIHVIKNVALEIFILIFCYFDLFKFIIFNNFLVFSTKPQNRGKIFKVEDCIVLSLLQNRIRLS